MAVATIAPEVLRRQREPFCVAHKDALVQTYQRLHPDATSLDGLPESLVTETDHYLIQHPWHLMGNTKVFDHKQWVNMFSGSGDKAEATAAFMAYFNDRLRSYVIGAWLREVELDERGNLIHAVFGR